MQTAIVDTEYPLVVDLDETLISTDLLHEGLILLLRKNPLYLFSCVIWILRGKAYLKNKIFTLIHIPAELLPYNTEILELLKREAEGGRKLVLATASLLSNALAIAAIHPIFYKIYGTENNVNLKSDKKLSLLIREFGKSKFDYIGNSYSDLKIFASARYSYLVNPSFLVRTKARKKSHVKQIWNFKKGPFKSYFKAIRMYQWVKNLLIFVPLITSHSFFSIRSLRLAMLAFVSFSLVASAGYLINDLLDLNADRIHPRKRLRPLASGRISILNGFVFSIMLLVAAFILASRLNYKFWMIVLFYFFTSLSYSIYLKRIVLYDVFVLAVLYSTRVFAGGVATNISLSSWLIAFSTFIFLSLAFVKRYSELLHVGDDNILEKRGRGYFVEDIPLLQTMGVVSGFLSVIVFSLYLDSPDVSILYSNPRVLWITSLLFLFWVSRIWMLTVRGKMTDDPIIYTLKDWVSYLILVLVALCILFAMYTS
jgi:4-hydroxybenzoate polyprenyltransferase